MPRRSTPGGMICLLFLTGVLLSCDDAQDITEPLGEQAADPWAQLWAPEAKLRWDGIQFATGPDGAQCATQELPSPECCQAFPSLPNCSWGNCGDERDDIIREYTFYGVSSLSPSCLNFASSGGSGNFSWSELNGGFTNGNPHNPWGIVTSGLVTGLEATRTNYNRGGILLTSGYRCPHGNNSVGGATQSYHMHGRAGDMYSEDHSWVVNGTIMWTEIEFNLMKAAAESTSPAPFLSFDWEMYADRHYHAAW